jgi:5-dehydro-4-deoxyglucarate dehydratase
MSRLSGILAFPLTPFTDAGAINLDVLRGEVDAAVESGAGAVFAACGTGEFFSLSFNEYSKVVRASVEQVAGRVPVVGGGGYGSKLAAEFASAAEQAGADGILMFPPYPVVAPQEGLASHYRSVAAATPLGLIIYQRDNAIFAPETVAGLADLQTLVAFKDGLGDMARLRRIRLLLGDRLVLLNGMPTAEIHAIEMADAGAASYSSSILNFMPEIAIAFQEAFAVGDVVRTNHLLDDAILPFAEIRGRQAGYPVSLTKAGARLRGRPVGRVRAPLTDPTAPDERDLRFLLSKLELV